MEPAHQQSVHRRSGKQSGSGERLLGLGLGVPALPPGRAAQFSVEVGVNESWVRVVLHQAVDFPLSRQEDAGVWLVEVLHDGVFGVEVQVYLRPDRNSERQHRTPVRRISRRRAPVTSLGASLLTNSS